MDPTHRYMLLQRRTWRHHPGMLSLQDMATECDLHPDVVKRFVALGIIDPVADDPNHFTPDAALRIRRLLRLRRDLGVNYSAAGLILELLERIEKLEARLQRYESE